MTTCDHTQAEHAVTHRLVVATWTLVIATLALVVVTAMLAAATAEEKERQHETTAVEGVATQR